MLHRVALDERLAKLPDWQQTLKLFTTSEIVSFPLATQGCVEAHLKLLLAGYKLEALFPHWQLLTHERATQHNLRVAAK